MDLKDVQSQIDKRGIKIHRVGIKGVKYPIVLLDKKRKKQHTIADIDLFVDLPKHYRGTHMSRFMEVLNKHRFNISVKTLDKILMELKEKLQAEKAEIILTFPYFITKEAPVTKRSSLMYYTCRIHGIYSDHYEVMLSVSALATSLCPCSKEISNYGAHNQRVQITTHIKMKKIVWIEELVKIMEESASSEIYSILKRPDEKYVTEKAYDNPKFVEDIVRDVVLRIKDDKRITWYKVEAESYESIHPYNAYACVEKED